MLTMSLKKRLIRVAQSFAPKDTRNLELNAIKGLKWSNENKFVIRYDSTVASYIAPNEEGWTSKTTGKRHDKNKGFIGQETVPQIKNILDDYFNEGKGFKTPKSKPDNDLKQIDRRIRVYKKSLELSRLMKEGN